MIDTLYVANVVQDTLKLVLQSSDNSSMLQIIMASTALVAVFVGPWISLRVAKKQIEIERIKIKENREIEEKKIRSELIYKNKQEWIVEFRTVIYDFSRFISKHLSDIDVQQQEKSERALGFIEQVDGFRTKIALLGNIKDPNIENINKNMFNMMIYYEDWDNAAIDLARAHIETSTFDTIEEIQKSFEA